MKIEIKMNNGDIFNIEVESTFKSFTETLGYKHEAFFNITNEDSIKISNISSIKAKE